jgi:hypothetical protein
MSVPTTVLRDWIEAKETERMAIERRRVIEDMLIGYYQVPNDFEGTETKKEEGYKIKINGRMNRKVDVEMAQEIAIEHGLTEHMRRLFRWKAEINKAAWEASDPAITTPLLAAITTTPGRPSFTIEGDE